MLLNINTFLGHLHPLIVHLPIGFLLLAILFELVSYFNRFRELKVAIPFTLFLGFVTAALASAFGYLLSLSGDYDPEILSEHKVAGIALAVVSGLLFLMMTRPFKKIVKANRRLFSAAFLILFALVNYTGHLGGILTHGGDYLSLDLISGNASLKPLKVEDALLFEDVIQPILNKRCAQCHREGKLKGELSVHSFAGLMKGGKSGLSIVGGNLEKSELYNRITLDPANEKHMPADGKTPLTAGETLVIKWWIGKGMAMKGIKIGDLKDADEIKPFVAQFLELGESSINTEVITKSENKINPDIPSVFNSGLIDSLRNEGLNVRIMLHQPVMLDITIPAGSGNKMNRIIGNLKTIAKNVIWLNLSNNGLTDTDVDFLPLMTNLEKLRLEKNPLTDQITKALLGLNHLEALNLNETKITRAGLEKLKQMPNLKRVYSWKPVNK